MSTNPGLKRYNLVLPEELYGELQSIAEKRKTSVVDILRMCIKVGILVDKIQDKPNASIVVREGNKEKELILLS